jgi:hypothetical protein
MYMYMCVCVCVCIYIYIYIYIYSDATNSGPILDASSLGPPQGKVMAMDTRERGKGGVESWREGGGAREPGCLPCQPREGTIS